MSVSRCVHVHCTVHAQVSSQSLVIDIDMYIEYNDNLFNLAQWLLNDFLGYLDEWEREMAGTPGLSQKEKQKLGLSRETVQGLKITGTI